MRLTGKNFKTVLFISCPPCACACCCMRTCTVPALSVLV